MDNINVDNEIWRDVRGYEGLYQVSNQGRVRCYDRLNVNNKIHHKSKIMKPYVVRGYETVSLRKDGKYKHHQLHRLVAIAFIPNEKKYPQVNNKDETKTNNCVDNLEWCTSKYNINYGTAPQRRALSQSIPINQYDLNGVFIKTHQSIQEAKRQTGVNAGHICLVCKGHRNMAGGYLWKYKL